MDGARSDLYRITKKWEKEARMDPRDSYYFQSILDEILFHADLRFNDYVPYRSEGEFPNRLKKWIDNVPNEKEKKLLFKLLYWITFIDKQQMQSLYRDAYRRIIVPWISLGTLSAEDMLSDEYSKKVLSILRQCLLLSITESFSFPDFLHVNDLAGLPRPHVLGEDKDRAKAILQTIFQKINKTSSANQKGIIVLEDFVGTGDTALKILIQIKSVIPYNWQLLFAPLIMLERGFSTLTSEPSLSTVNIEPVLIVPKAACIPAKEMEGEPFETKHIRPLIRSTKKQVCERFNEFDDPAADPFGYKGSGALLVTCHNTPNNTLPAIHHRAPSWSPLFRRLHHSKDGLR